MTNPSAAHRFLSVKCDYLVIHSGPSEYPNTRWKRRDLATLRKHFVRNQRAQVRLFVIRSSFVIRASSLAYALPRFTGIGFPDSSTATSVKTPCVTRSSSPLI